jgi:hypothetical protein
VFTLFKTLSYNLTLISSLFADGIQYLQKFSIKGATATFNQGQNIFNAYFELAEEAQSDGSIDLTELVYLVQKYRDTLSGLKKVQQALIELGDEKKAAVIEECMLSNKSGLFQI